MKSADALIVIPARYGSRRLPGKPLRQISGHSMLERVVRVATTAAAELQSCDVVIATDDNRIRDHARELGHEVLMTSPRCRTGTERVYSAASSYDSPPRWVVNLQGDAPLTPPFVVKEVIRVLRGQVGQASAVTPVTRLSWAALNDLRKHKSEHPFSGTTVIVAQDGRAIWFSKAIIPAIRDEPESSFSGEPSPVYRHIGVYGYPFSVLQRYVSLNQTHYEKLEGLEQLRILESGLCIKTVSVELGDLDVLSGVDTEADLRRVEEWLRQNGDPLDTPSRGEL